MSSRPIRTLFASSTTLGTSSSSFAQIYARPASARHAVLGAYNDSSPEDSVEASSAMSMAHTTPMPYPKLPPFLHPPWRFFFFPLQFGFDLFCCFYSGALFFTRLHLLQPFDCNRDVPLSPASTPFWNTFAMSIGVSSTTPSLV